LPLEIERKFLLSAAPDWSHPVLRGARLIQYEQVYLRVAGDAQTRIRRGTDDEGTRYHLARLHRLRDGVREVEEEEISAAEYARLRQDRDPRRQVVVKDRRCFHWRAQFFELDEIHRPVSRACHLLEIQVDELGRRVELPDFLPIDREVTGEPAFGNAGIALG
jgi:CYTH domain-containing protein